METANVTGVKNTCAVWKTNMTHRGRGGARRTTVRFAADSGAVDTVMKDEELKMHKKTESQKSKMGVKYKAAGGKEIPNKGQKTLVVETEDGKERKMAVQIADVRKPLASVAKICDQGNQRAGGKPQMQREGDLYYLYVWVDHEKTKKMGEVFQGHGKK